MDASTHAALVALDCQQQQTCCRLIFLQFFLFFEAAAPEQAAEIKNTKLINYDLKWAGENRSKLVEKWSNAVKKQ